MSIDRQMVKEDVCVCVCVCVCMYTHSGISLSHKKEQDWVICRGVDGPRVVLSEVSQKEKNMLSS